MNSVESQGLPMEKDHVPAQKIIGISIRTSNKEAFVNNSIGRCVERFYGEDLAAQIPNKISKDVFAIYTEYEGMQDDPYTYILGCPVSTFETVPDGFVPFEIPAGEYTIVPAVGELPGAVIQAWQTIWSEMQNRSFTVDFEVYGEGVFQTPPIVPIYLTVKE